MSHGSYVLGGYIGQKAAPFVNQPSVIPPRPRGRVTVKEMVGAYTTDHTTQGGAGSQASAGDVRGARAIFSAPIQGARRTGASRVVGQG